MEREAKNVGVTRQAARLKFIIAPVTFMRRAHEPEQSENTEGNKESRLRKRDRGGGGDLSHKSRTSVEHKSIVRSNDAPGRVRSASLSLSLSLDFHLISQRPT